MKGRWLWILIGANLAVLVALAFVYPHLMVAPGPLSPGHAALTTDCFACHQPLRGATSARCVTCHAPADIGLRTTRGLALQPAAAGRGSPLKRSFHQELIEQDCMACHSDHAGPRLSESSRRAFSHALLKPAAREACEGCHAAPADAQHRQLDGACASCHSTAGWTPASFDHDRFFLLDGDHKASCVTCHPGKDYRQYTCYGCHEHTVDKVRRKHLKEGVPEFENCVACHRSAHDEPRREGGRDGNSGRDGKGERKRSERD
jgi:Class III cytochrome C family